MTHRRTTYHPTAPPPPGYPLASLEPLRLGHPTAPPSPVERHRTAYPLAALVLAAWLRRVAPPDDRGRDRPTAISAWLADRGVEAPPVTVRHWLRGKLPHPATLDAVAPLVASPREYERLLEGLYR